MRSSTLLTSAFAVGALALPQGQLEKRQQVTVYDTVTVTVTVFVNPYTTPAWAGPPQFSQNQPARPTNAPPLWTPPRVGNPSRPTNAPAVPSPSSRVISSSSISRPSSPAVGPIGGSSSTPPGIGPIGPSSTPIVGSPSPSIGLPIEQPSNAPGASATPTPAPSGAPLDPGHTPGTGQATLSAGLEYQNAILYHHNAARANHGAAPLVWDDAVARTAALAAQTCRFEHYIPAGAGQGQNLFTVSGNFFNVTAGITESWYKGEFQQMRPYFGSASIPTNIFPSVGHLTQILWKGTTRVGCVSIDCGNRMIVGGASSTLNKYTVCNYAPAGNVAGRYALNVGLPNSLTDLGSWRD